MSKPRAYYNEWDPYAADWVRNLIAAGHIPAGDVDTRSIEDVHPDDLRGYTQAHFFAGISGWALALRLAGWGDDRPAWSGSAPCQPFSQAGRGAGVDDERHLWPVFYKLIEAHRPPVVFGEQVASADVIGKAVKGSRRKAEGTNRPAWLDIICDDLERAHYAVGSTAFPACSIGAPHIRLRLYWAAQYVGNADGAGRQSRHVAEDVPARGVEQASGSDGLADGGGEGLEGRHEGALGRERPAAERGGCAGGLADMPEPGRYEWPQRDAGTDGRPATEPGRLRAPGRGPGPTNGFWGNADWLLCRDDKWRPVEPVHV